MLAQSPTVSNGYLSYVRKFADSLLIYGTDKYGSKQANGIKHFAEEYIGDHLNMPDGFEGA